MENLPHTPILHLPNLSIPSTPSISNTVISFLCILPKFLYAYTSKHRSYTYFYFPTLLMTRGNVLCQLFCTLLYHLIHLKGSSISVHREFLHFYYICIIFSCKGIPNLVI